MANFFINIFKRLFSFFLKSFHIYGTDYAPHSGYQSKVNVGHCGGTHTAFPQLLYPVKEAYSAPQTH